VTSRAANRASPIGTFSRPRLAKDTTRYHNWHKASNASRNGVRRAPNARAEHRPPTPRVRARSADLAHQLPAHGDAPSPCLPPQRNSAHAAAAVFSSIWRMRQVGVNLFEKAPSTMRTYTNYCWESHVHKDQGQAPDNSFEKGTSLLRTYTGVGSRQAWRQVLHLPGPMQDVSRSVVGFFSPACHFLRLPGVVIAAIWPLTTAQSPGRCHSE
jgi:hypothetical protein